VNIQARTNPPDRISPEFLKQLGDDKDNPVVFHAQKVFLLGEMEIVDFVEFYVIAQSPFLVNDIS
jgi:hypothetical protein